MNTIRATETTNYIEHIKHYTVSIDYCVEQVHHTVMTDFNKSYVKTSVKYMIITLHHRI